MSSVVLYGEPLTGGEFHLGPVDYAETSWHNACASVSGYDDRIREAQGSLLAGLWNGVPNVSAACDSCIFVTTEAGKSALLRVVTYGATTANSIDVSPEAYALLDSGEYPRWMTWQFAKCAETGPLIYEFQTGSHEWWTSFWVRNPRVPVTNVEVMSTNHADWFSLTRGSDGTLTDASGFGSGRFSIRVTGMDGQQIVDEFDWPADGIAGAFLTGSTNFD